MSVLRISRAKLLRFSTPNVSLHYYSNIGFRNAMYTCSCSIFAPGSRLIRSDLFFHDYLILLIQVCDRVPPLDFRSSGLIFFPCSLFLTKYNNQDLYRLSCLSLAILTSFLVLHLILSSAGFCCIKIDIVVVNLSNLSILRPPLVPHPFLVLRPPLSLRPLFGLRPLVSQVHKLIILHLLRLTA